LVGTWTRTREVIRGTYFNLDHQTTEVPIIVTLSYWNDPMNVLSFNNRVATINNYQRLGSSNKWLITFTSNNAFSLSNTVEGDDNTGTEIIDFYTRVLP